MDKVTPASPKVISAEILKNEIFKEQCINEILKQESKEESDQKCTEMSN